MKHILHILPSARESFSEFIHNFCHVENVFRVAGDDAVPLQALTFPVEAVSTPQPFLGVDGKTEGALSGAERRAVQTIGGSLVRRGDIIVLAKWVGRGAVDDPVAGRLCPSAVTPAAAEVRIPPPRRACFCSASAPRRAGDDKNTLRVPPSRRNICSCIN